MPAAVSVAGAAFTVSLGTPAVQYECQITSGTVETNPTILRTKTLSCVAYDQVDLISSVSLDYLYDENSGMYEALQSAITAATPVAVTIASAVGTWVSTAMYVNAANVAFPADGIATCTVGLEGEIVFT
jgi:hypothetical protein|tara:strand:- start:381 stop:767 length:387 start_codon:yes stop_codon:yes gene_type:complete